MGNRTLQVPADHGVVLSSEILYIRDPQFESLQAFYRFENDGVRIIGSAITNLTVEPPVTHITTMWQDGAVDSFEVVHPSRQDALRLHDPHIMAQTLFDQALRFTQY